MVGVSRFVAFRRPVGVRAAARGLVGFFAMCNPRGVAELVLVRTIAELVGESAHLRKKVSPLRR